MAFYNKNNPGAVLKPFRKTKNVEGLDEEDLPKGEIHISKTTNSNTAQVKRRIDDGPSTAKKFKVDEENLTNNNKPHYNPSFHKKHKSTRNIQEEKAKLPISDVEVKDQLVDLMKKYNKLIVLADTGSGKTTQIPQIIYNAGLLNNGKIGITQPRRVAAISIAQRVALEMNANIGGLVGYSVRFEDVTSKKTKIKYLTDGMLLREAMQNKLLMGYDFIILDEAHERSVYTDVLFGVVKNAQKERFIKHLPPLKVIIMSATMMVDHFADYFKIKNKKIQVALIEGRVYPIINHYMCRPSTDYLQDTLNTIFQYHKAAPANHDVLVFLTGQEEIESMAFRIRELAKDPKVMDGSPEIFVHTLYAAQSSQQQMSVFESAPENTRKVILTTNIAETSVTISGIKCVIDSGMVKSRVYHPATGFETLKIQRISQEQADQRLGRAGRESEGICYRLYTSKEFDMMEKSTVPEILRSNLATVALQLLALNVHMKHFDFIDKPSDASIKAAFEQLKTLGAVEDVDTISLTPLGKKMARFPLDPRFSKILLSASDFRCLEEALSIVAVLSVDSILINSVRKRDQIEKERKRFRSPLGDHLQLLEIYRAYEKIGDKKNMKWCYKYHLNCRNLQKAKLIRQQLKELCERCELKFSSCGEDVDRIRRCLLTGLFMNVAEYGNDRKYCTLDKRQSVSIHPSSELHTTAPPVVLFTEVVNTTKCYMRIVTSIEPEWLREVVPEYAKTHRIRCLTD